MIQKLTWDSDFFGFEIGEISNESDLQNANDFKLLILKQLEEQKIEIKEFQSTFSETKVIFSKKITNQNLDLNNISDADIETLNAYDLYKLAYESGKHSRFLLDKNFEQSHFLALYEKWIDNSLNKQFADKIFYLKEDKVVGFVSLKKHQNHAMIGLIAVDASQQGKGIGKQLLQKAEQYCFENNIFELRIPTQKENQQACSFYTKSGYSIFEATIIKHYWRK